MKAKYVTQILFVGALAVFGSTVFIGCGSSIKKADIASTANPTEEIGKLDTGVSEGYANQYDVLAQEDFSQGIKYLDRAKEGLKRGRKQADVLDDIAYSNAFLERAKEVAQSRQGKLEGLLKPRKAALAAGARNFPELRERLDDLDKDFIGDVSNLEKDLTLKEFEVLQTGYQNLELSAIQQTQLGNARSMIVGAIDGGAKKRAPTSLQAAEFDLATAENNIAVNRNNPTAYQVSVAKSNASARFLVDVLNAMNTSRSKLAESDAVKLINQRNELRKLKGEVGEAQERASKLDKTLKETSRELSAAQGIVGLEKALDNARSQFSEDEAEVYEQSGKLLIRVKSMAFPSGRAELPASSLQILAKVKDVAMDFNPSEIVVEGHTDSTGKAQTNKALSEKRAAAVAEYLQANGVDATKVSSVGYGFEKPIATNKSAAGRAQNRRVDVIITPGPAATSVQ